MPRAAGIATFLAAGWLSPASAQLVNGDFKTWADGTTTNGGTGSEGSINWTQLGKANPNPNSSSNIPQLQGWVIQPAGPNNANPGITGVALTNNIVAYDPTSLNGNANATPIWGKLYGAGGNAVANSPSFATVWASPGAVPGGYTGNILVADADGQTAGPGRGSPFATLLQQTVTGLTNGATYALSFYQAAAQQTGFDGALTDWFRVTAPGGVVVNGFQGTCSIGCLADANHGATGWQKETINNVITFLAQSNETTGSEPPIMLLANVTLTKVPEPASFALLAAGLGGIAAFRRRKAKAAAV